MGAQPKKKISHSRQGMRRSHQHNLSVHLVACPQCRQPVRAHTVCSFCGYYGGEQVVAEAELKRTS